LLQISEKLGYEFTYTQEKITFVACIDSEKDAPKAISIFESVTYQNKELLIIVKSNINDYSFLDRNMTLINEKRSIEYFETLNKLTETDYLAPISIHDFYAENYLTDLIIAVQYTNADIIGKQNYFMSNNDILEEVNEGSEHEFTETVNINSSIIKIGLFSNFNLQESLKYLKNTMDISELNYLGLKIYSNDKMNYIKHGSKVSDEQKYKVIV